MTYDEALERVKIEVGLQLSELLERNGEPREALPWSIAGVAAYLGSAADHAGVAHLVQRVSRRDRTEHLLAARGALVALIAAGMRAVIALDAGELSFHHNAERKAPNA